MNPLRMFLLIALLGGLTFVLLQFASERKEAMPDPTENVQRSERSLLAGKPEDVRSVMIYQERLGLRVRLERDGNRWTASEPIPDRAEPGMVVQAFHHLFGSEWEEADPYWDASQPEQLGLKPARIVVETDFADGHREVLRLGAQTVDGASHAAELDGRLIRVGLAIPRFFERPPGEWRDQAVFEAPSTIRAVTWIPNEGPELRVVRKDAGWFVEQPFSARLDRLAEDSFKRMLGARTVSLPEDPLTADVRERAKTAPRFVVEAPYGKRNLIFLGDAMIDESRPSGMVVYPGDFEFLNLTPDQMRSRYLLSLEAELIASIFFEHRGRKVHFKRAKAGDGVAWQGPREALLDQKQGALLEYLMNFALTLERGPEIDRPKTPPTGSIRLSRWHGTAQRGTEAILWWVREDATILAGAENMDRCIRLGSNQNIELAVADLLKDFES